MGCICSQQRRQNSREQTLIIESLTDIKDDDDIMIMQIKLVQPKFLYYHLNKENSVKASNRFLDPKISEEGVHLNPKRKLKGILKQQQEFPKKRPFSFDQFKLRLRVSGIKFDKIVKIAQQENYIAKILEFSNCISNSLQKLMNKQCKQLQLKIELIVNKE